MKTSSTRCTGPKPFASAGGVVARAQLVIADDHPDIRNRVVRLLERDFEVVSEVSNGAEALEAVARLTPDIVVLDITMPGLTGIEIAHRMKAGGSNAKIVFLTVIEDADFVREALAAGGSAYVVKSRMTGDLPFAISEVLAGRVFVSPLLA